MRATKNNKQKPREKGREGALDITDEEEEDKGESSMLQLVRLEKLTWVKEVEGLV